jgi:hypothetical protein
VTKCAHSEKCLEELSCQAFTKESFKMKIEFTKQMTTAIENSEQRMTVTIQTHIGKIMHTSNEAIKRMEQKSNEITKSHISNHCNTSPPHKQHHHNIYGNVDANGNDTMITPFASPTSAIQNGEHPMASMNK